MNSNRISAVIIGVLYIIGTVTGILSVVLTNPILESPDYLTNLSAQPNRLVSGMLMVLTMGLALAMVPVVMYPISKKYNPTLALGYVLFRGALETFTYLFSVISTLLLLTVGRAYAAADAAQVPIYEAIGAVLHKYDAWGAQITTIVFILGALMFYYVLYRYKLVPRWLSGWGLLGAIPYLAAGFLVMFGFLDHFSTADALLRVPLGLQEMVLAVWLIVKGFNPSSSAPESA
jgi:hypothetical protein